MKLALFGHDNSAYLGHGIFELNSLTYAILLVSCGCNLKLTSPSIVFESRLVRGFELGCIKCHCFKPVLYCMIRSLPKQGQIPCIELGIELKKMQDLCPDSGF